MRLTLVVDQRYWVAPDRSVWTRMPPDWRFFARHLEIFESVSVMARTIAIDQPPPGSIRADGPGLQFRHIPDYQGPRQFLSRAMEVSSAARRNMDASEALLLRVPSNVANCLPLHRQAYGVEVLADPEELYAARATASPLRGAYRAWFRWHIRRQCAAAVAASYASQALAAKYPSPLSHVLLDIELPGEAFGSVRRRPRKDRFEIVTAGGFDHPVKGHDVLIRAAAEAKRRGTAVRVSIVGEGRLKEQLQQMAEREGVSCRFVGQLGGSAEVRQVLQTADLFVLASRSEGKPRVLIEAMALGVPVVATAVGGIPEVLPAEQLVPRDDVDVLAAAIDGTLRDGSRYQRISEQGIAAARPFALAEQWSKRKEFLFALKDGCHAASLNRSIPLAKR